MPKSPNEKKAHRERQYLESLVHLLDFHEVGIKSLSPPAPDLALTVGSDVIGVEVTEYYSHPRQGEMQRRAVDTEWERLRRQLMREIDLTPALEGIHGTICFTRLEVPPKGSHRAFVTEIIRCTQAYAKIVPASATDFSAEPLVSQYVKQIRLKRINSRLSWGWNQNTAWLGTDSKAFVDCIRRKTVKNYDRHDLSNLWLLIVSGPHLSQALGMDLHLVLPKITDAEELLKNSGFAKAYVLQYMFDVAYEWPGWRKIGQENFRTHHAHRDAVIFR